MKREHQGEMNAIYNGWGYLGDIWKMDREMKCLKVLDEVYQKIYQFTRKA